MNRPAFDSRNDSPAATARATTVMAIVAVLWATISIALVSCGGGGSGGLASSGGGIGGTGQAVGEVDGFGSVFSLGVQWNTDNADFVINGVNGSQTGLSIGMVVTIDGAPDISGVTGTAQTVTYEPEVRGVVQSLTADADGQRLTLDVLGLSVIVDRDLTTLDGLGFETIAVDQVFEISGFFDDNGFLRATYMEFIEIFQIGSRLELSGVVANFDGISRFDLGPLTVDFDPNGVDTDLTGLSAGIANGEEVRVRGDTVAGLNILATDIDSVDDSIDDVDHTRIEGFITDFAGFGNFRVNGRPVDASSAVLVPFNPLVFNNGARVQVEGPTVGGVLIAESLERRGTAVRISAEVANDADVDAAAGTITLLGVLIDIDNSTLLEDDRDGIADFGLADIVAGDFIEIRGFEDPSGLVIATRLERDSTDDVILQAHVDAFDPVSQSISILGLLITTDADTEYEDLGENPLDAAAFFSQLASGDLIKIKDDEDGTETTLDVADEIEFELEDD